MRLAVITDEIGPRLEDAARVAAELGIRSLELRTVDGAPAVDLAPGARRRVADLLVAGGFDCCAIASPYLKSRPEEDGSAQLNRALDLAIELGAPFVRCFSWWREPDPDAVRPRLLAVLADAAARAREAGLRLLLENEHACNVGTAEEAAWYLERVPDLGLIWDPGNQAMLGGQPFPDGYRVVRERVAHVHVKDVTRAGAWTVAGEGLCDWGGQLAALAADGYRGALSIETHLGDGEAATRRAVAALRALLPTGRGGRGAGVPS